MSAEDLLLRTRTVLRRLQGQERLDSEGFMLLVHVETFLSASAEKDSDD